MKEITFKNLLDFEFLRGNDLVYLDKFQTLKISNIIIKDKLIIGEKFKYNFEIEDLEFENCEFDEIEVDVGVLIESLDFKNCKINKITYNLEDEKVDSYFSGRLNNVKNLTVLGGKESSIHVTNGKFKKIDIMFLNFGEFTLIRGDVDSFRIGNDFEDEKRFDNYSSILNIEIGHSNMKNTSDAYIININDLNIKSNKIKTLNLNGANIQNLHLGCNIKLDSYFGLNNIKVNNLKIENLKNLGQLEFVDLYPLNNNSNVNIMGTSFNDAVFRNCNLLDFKTVKIQNSDLGNLKLNNTPFPLNIIGDSDDLYEVYNDLYATAIRSNNTKAKVDYYKATQENLLNVKINQEKSRERTGSIIALKVSKWLSSFGTDWLKVIARMLMISIPVYLLILITLSNSVYDLSVNSILDTISRFFLFVNPLRGTSFIDGLGSYSPVSIIIDFFFRIFMAIAIFELIRSFRKYVRK